MNDKNITPSRPRTVAEKVFSSSMHCDSPFRRMPNLSTPPSRFAKIKNPFESPLIERLHLPVCSPGVFAMSTPRQDDKFKWTICEISNLKPADIDESTYSQHVHINDPQKESMIQEKIISFFNERSVVPSPFNEDVKRVPLISKTETPEWREGATQTKISISPLLDIREGEVLMQYEQPKTPRSPDSSYYKKLFPFETDSNDDLRSIHSSPPLSTGFSPLQLSPIRGIQEELNESACSDLGGNNRDWTLSPIEDEDIVGEKSNKESKSACRLNFSGHMSVDTSMVVPDVLDHFPNKSVSMVEENFHYSPEELNNSTVNWDMEYKNVSLISSKSHPELMDISNLSTPSRSRTSTNHKKRLSRSFKSEKSPQNSDDEFQVGDINRVKSRLFAHNLSDDGYHTRLASEDTTSWEGCQLFASTPSKNKLRF